jgi:neutral trehalase
MPETPFGWPEYLAIAMQSMQSIGDPEIEMQLARFRISIDFRHMHS